MPTTTGGTAVPAWAGTFPHRPLAPGEVRVHCALLADLRRHHRQLAGTLATLERDRAARFLQARDRLEFILSHGFLRRILGLHLACPPGDPGLPAGGPGRPALPADCGLDCSLARTRGAAACAVGANLAVGVDLERQVRLPDLPELAEAALAPRERTAFSALPPALRERAFLLLWVSKEAVLKLDGVGLAVPPRDLVVAPLCWDEASFSVSREGRECRVQTFAFMGRFLGALATRPAPAGIQFSRFGQPGPVR